MAVTEIMIKAVTPEAILKAEPLGFQLRSVGTQGPGAVDYIDDTTTNLHKLWSSQKTSDEIAAEAAAREASDTTEATARANADTAEATARANADSAEATARANAISAEATARTNAVSQVASDLATEATTRAAADAAAAVATADVASDLSIVIGDVGDLQADVDDILHNDLTLGGVKTFSVSPLVPTKAPGDNSLAAASTAFTAAAIASATAPLATSQALTDGLALKAPLASPVFTGTPAAPTPATNDNSTKLATTGFVAAAVAAAITALVNLAPTTLDTLGELAAQMQADETGVAALTTAVGTKAPLAGAAFTGAISAPSLSLTGALSAASSTLTGALSAGSASLSGGLTAASSTLSGQLSAYGGTFWDQTPTTGDTIVTLRSGAAGMARLKLTANDLGSPVGLSPVSGQNQLQINNGTFNSLGGINFNHWFGGSSGNNVYTNGFAWLDPTGTTTFMNLTNAGVLVFPTTMPSGAITFNKNNVVNSRQMNAAGNSYNLLGYYDGDDRYRHALTSGVCYVGASSGSGGTYPYTFAAFQATSMPLGTGNNTATTLLQAFVPVVNFTTNSVTAGPTSQGRLEAFNLSGNVLGGDLVFTLYNSDNTYGYSNTSLVASNVGTLASASNNCGLRLLGRQFGGDLYIRLDNQATQTWQFGLDNNDGAKFKLASSSALGNNDRLAIWKDGSTEHNIVWAASNTFTGTTVVGSNIITATSFIGSLRVGDTITGTGIPASTTVVAFQADGGVALSANATSAGTGVTFTADHSTATLRAFKLNVTDSGSAAASLLLDLQKGGVSQHSFGKSGDAFHLGNVGIGAVSSATATLTVNKAYANPTTGTSQLALSGQYTLATGNGVSANAWGMVLSTIYSVSGDGTGALSQGATALWQPNVMLAMSSAATVGISTLRAARLNLVFNGNQTGRITTWTALDITAIQAGGTNNGQIGTVQGVVLADQGTVSGFVVSNAMGVAIGDQNSSGNMSNLVLGQTSVPAGTWSIYNVSTRANFFGGSLQSGPHILNDVGTTTSKISFTIESAVDSVNTGVSALWLYPNTDNFRLFFGKSGKKFFAADFSNVVSLTGIGAVTFYNSSPGDTLIQIRAGSTANARLVLGGNNGVSFDVAYSREAAGLAAITDGATTPSYRDLKARDLFLVPSASLTPTNNGDLRVEATSNTTLTFKYKGSDGVVRSGALALA